MPLRHIVLFRIHPEVPETRISEAFDALVALGQEPGIEHWTIERSLDDRKGVVLVENGLFKTAEAFQSFRAGEAHQALVATMREIADWFVGDYAEPAKSITA